MNDNTGTFVFEPSEIEPVGSVLYEEHIKLVNKSRMADFAGYLMPLWYSSISAEHQAVRQTAGLFDCSHMGVLEVLGDNAESFLNVVTTNDVSKLSEGKAQYSYILDAAGNVLDDVIIYKRPDRKYMVVVNAANEPKIKSYLHGLLNDRVMVDVSQPERKIEFKPEFRDMRDQASGEDCRVDLALQGPASIDILSVLVDSGTRKNIEKLKSFNFIESKIDGIDCIISKTGYAGAKVGFELFVDPNKAVELWRILLEAGEPKGLVPCGLGARDSLRIQAGLPLYGHELDGKFQISPFEAGYGWTVKLDKEFFIGKSVMEEIAENYQMEVKRIDLEGGKGVRPVRPDDAVLDEDGKCQGWVLSCAKAGQSQIALGFVSRNMFEEGQSVGAYYLARRKSQVKKGRKEQVKKQEVLQPDVKGKVLKRFARF